MKEKIRSIVFMGLLLSLSLANIASPKNVFSNKENRYLQEFPKLNKKTIISGQFSKDFETYTTDQFVGRDNWISLKTISDLAMLKKDNTRVYFGKDHYLFNVDNKLDEEQLENNVNNINKFLEKLEEYKKDIKVSSLLVPTKSGVLKDRLPLYAPIVNEKDIIDRLISSIKDNMNIIDLKESLDEKKDEYIYYKTDHHWTSIGAFYAYQYYMRQNVQIPLELKDFIITTVSDDFLGTSYRKANLYLGNPDEIHIYKPKKEVSYEITVNNSIKEDSLYNESFLNKTDKYSYFFGGDKSLIEIETSIKNNKNILIIKDSFANSFIPFLTNHYENISIIDPRYFNTSVTDYIEEKNIDEVLFLFNVQTFVQEKSFNIFGR